MIFLLAEVDRALRASWASDTCSTDDAARTPWTAANPAWGHCDITALVLNDILGGDLMVGEVHLDGQRHGYHWWNRLVTGVEIDLTREQFQHGQRVSAGRLVNRPPEPPRYRNEEYLLFSRRVMDKLSSMSALDASNAAT
ncbi:MAG: YunG family protein [Acidimicrobiales bacterium]